jgi:hypothetical protein
MSLLDRETAARLSAALVSRAGGYLRNPVRQDGTTCAVCTTPTPGYKYCIQCNNHRVHAGLADNTAFLTYAVAGDQSGYVMRGYKASNPVDEHVAIVAMLILPGLSMHLRCAGALKATPVTVWATVPSLPAKPGEHPLHRILVNSSPGPEVKLIAATKAQNPREVNPKHFTSSDQLVQGSHVLLIDDTWTSGGHAQSAVLALRQAGATYVSVLEVARWIRTDFGDNAKFLRGISGRDYDPRICPWTGGDCPP